MNYNWILLPDPVRPIFCLYQNLKKEENNEVIKKLLWVNVCDFYL